ncbi:unnamed protein product, partial [Adineta steineri]
QCFKCSFDEYQHNLDTDDKELNEAFDTICQGHQDVLKRLKQPLLYRDFLLSIHSTSSKLVHLLLIISPNQVQHLPISYDYSSSIQIPQQKPITNKIDRFIVNKIVDYMGNKNSSDTIKSSLQLPSFGPALSRRSSVSLTSSHATNLCYLSDKDFSIFSYAHRLYLNLLTPSDIRTRLDQLPQINNTDVSSPLFRLRIELLIHAHTCFINSYHTERICFST